MIKGLNERTTAGGFKVYVGHELLNPKPSQQLINHSPDGFAWGYGGSGPAQLALALLLWFADRDFALANYQKFKWDVVAKLPVPEFELSERVVKDWIKEVRNNG